MAEVRVYGLDDEAWRMLKAIAALRGVSANALTCEILKKAAEDLWAKSSQAKFRHR